MKRLILAAVSLICLLICNPAQALVVVGSVKSTDNKPLPGVTVSDGVQVVQTDSRGLYSLDCDFSTRFIWVSTPAGYRSSAFPGETCFYKELVKGTLRYDFKVVKKSFDDRTHRLIAFADPQIQFEEDMDLLEPRMQDFSATAAEVSGSEDVISVCLGDIVGYNHAYYPEINRIFGKAGVDMRFVIGNHDMQNYGRSNETSQALYEDTYGPVYYSFNAGRIHYIVMDDIFYVGRDYFYIGYLEERQLAWLEKDLATVMRGSNIILCLHIPTTLSKEDRDEFKYDIIGDNVCNKLALYQMLEPYHATILSGHMHTQTNSVISDHIYEHNIGGMCGAWWCGDTCIDGCPPGYKVFDIDGNNMEWYYKGAGYPKDYQLKVYSDCSLYPGKVIAHVWDYDPEWKVEYLEDGIKVCDMTNFKGQEPYAHDEFADPSKYKISWVYSADTPNLFSADLNPEATKHEVRVTDRFGRVYSQTW